MVASKINIDNLEEILELDKKRVLSSVESLAEQCQQAWDEVSRLKVKDDYRGIENIVVVGMGGSALGAELVKAVYADRLKVPLEIIRGYHLPRYVDSKTLVLLSSYSGETEEVLAAGKEAEEMGARIMAIFSGGELERVAREKGYDSYKIVPNHNPCGQPRMALGYSVMGILGLMELAGVIKVSDEEIDGIIALVERIGKECGVGVFGDDNPAKRVARRLEGRVLMVLGAEHLSGNPKIFCNSINENAKIPAFPYLLPEANHHLMEGLKKPETNKDNLMFLLLGSDRYAEEIKKRIAVTKKVIEKNGISMVDIKAEGKSRLEEAFYLLAMGGWVIFYLAMLYGIDPSLIPWVDYFKEEMKKS